MQCMMMNDNEDKLHVAKRMMGDIMNVYFVCSMQHEEFLQAELPRFRSWGEKKGNMAREQDQNYDSSANMEIILNQK